jgi:phage gpG-like protein
MSFKNTRTGRDMGDEMRENTQKLEVLLKKKLPEKTAVVLEKTIHDSWEHEQYQDGKSPGWKGRKKPVTGRKLLVEDGTMKRSVEVEFTEGEVKATSDVVYFNVHNEGLRSGRSSGFTMPQRQVAPIPGERNEKVDTEVEKWLNNEMDKIFL